MSNTANTAFLEYHYEEGLAMGRTEEEAEEYAYKKFYEGM